MNACFDTYAIDDSVARIIETMVRLADETMIPLALILERVLIAGYQTPERIVRESGCSVSFVTHQLLELLRLRLEEDWRLKVAALTLK